MPPKQRITREMILERSFTMFCQEGMEAVNARSVAKALNLQLLHRHGRSEERA